MVICLEELLHTAHAWNSKRIANHVAEQGFFVTQSKKWCWLHFDNTNIKLYSVAGSRVYMRIRMWNVKALISIKKTWLFKASLMNRKLKGQHLLKQKCHVTLINVFTVTLISLMHACWIMVLMTHIMWSVTSSPSFSDSLK